MFVGYGITAKKENYDDYAGIDVKRQGVIVLRHEPQQDNPHSVFDGTKTSPHAPFMRKISNAYEHGAAAIIFVTDDFEIRKNVAERQKRWQEALDKLAEAYQKFRQIEKPTREQLEEHRKQIDDLAAQVRSQGDKLAAEYDPADEVRSGRHRKRAGAILSPCSSCGGPRWTVMVKSALGKDLAGAGKGNRQRSRAAKPRAAGLADQGRSRRRAHQGRREERRRRAGRRRSAGR